MDKRSRTFPAWKGVLPHALAGLFGALVAVYLAGHAISNPTDASWLVGEFLGEQDRASHYFGWMHFRDDIWRFPLGANPGNGLELGSSIVYSDSIPLLAFSAKLLAGLIDTRFHYFGFWVLCCFVLQGIAGYRLARLASPHWPIALVASAMFVLSPVLIERISRHLTLGGQFLILAALILVFDNSIRKKNLLWIALLAVSTLVHFYFLAMVAALWLGDLIVRFRQGDAPKGLLAEFAGGYIAVFLCAWISGYLMIGQGSASYGYGVFNLNLLAPVASNSFGRIPDIWGEDWQAEGFGYLGLGAILLGGLAIVLFFKHRALLMPLARFYLPVILILVGLWAFAVTNRIGIGPLSLEVPLPLALKGLANFLRSSARMFWPIYYFAIFASIFVVCRAFRPRHAMMILVAAVGIQLIDIWPGMERTRNGFASDASFVPLERTGRIWELAATRYSRMRFLPVGGAGEEWLPLADYAARNSIDTDIAYLARVDRKGFEIARKSSDRLLEDGNFDPDTLYVFDKDRAERIAALPLPDHMLFAEIGKRYVLASGMKECDCAAEDTRSREK